MTKHHTCTRCGASLNPRTLVWLELNAKTGRYTDPAHVEIPEGDSQGTFPFGRDCAAAIRSAGPNGGRVR